MDTHLHHKIPRHMGGSDDPSNLVRLTVPEHAEAHRVLFETFGKKEDEIAYRMLKGLISVEEARRLATIESNKNRVFTPEIRENYRQAQLGKKHTPETIAKMKLRRHTPETKAKIAANHKGMKGKKHSEESKLKISLTKAQRMN
jgi:hypothetical protein